MSVDHSGVSRIRTSASAFSSSHKTCQACSSLKYRPGSARHGVSPHALISPLNFNVGILVSTLHRLTLYQSITQHPSPAPLAMPFYLGVQLQYRVHEGLLEVATK